MQVEQLAVALERLTGAVEGANMCDNCVVYDVLGPCMQPMLAVQRAFRHHELVTRILFALAAAMAREHSGEARREGGLLGAAVRPSVSSYSANLKRLQFRLDFRGACSVLCGCF